MNILDLSKRLTALVHLAVPGNVVADVGCDHGYVVIWLLSRGIFNKGIAMDVRKGPLEAATANCHRYRMEDKMELRLSDGLTKYAPGDSDAIICAGMGGALMRSILEREPEKLAGVKQLILQPQSEIFLVRRFLRENGFVIEAEDMILEDGKFYPMMRAVPVKPDKEKKREELSNEQQEAEDYYGPVLLREKHPVLYAYLEKETGIISGIKEKLEQGKQGSEKSESDKAELEKRSKRVMLAKARFE